MTNESTDARARPGRPRPGRPGRGWAGRSWAGLGWAALGTVLLALGALPGARVPIIGDDLQALFETYAIADGDLGAAAEFGWNQGFKAGHFNPVGQALGAAYHYGAFAVSSALGISPQYYDVAVAGLLMWLSVAAAALILTWGLRTVAVPGRTSYWRMFALVGAIAAATIQNHPWSNDPVTSFGPAGWGSAAIGLTLVGLALRATMPGRRGWTDFVLVGGLGVFAVLYYEMLAGMVAGAGVVYLAAVARAWVRRDRPELIRTFLLGVVGAAVPVAIFLGGRLLAVPPEQSNYTGTSLALGLPALATWWAAIVGALPGGGWPYLIAMVSGVVTLTPHAMLLAAALCLGIAVLVSAWSRAARITLRWNRSWLIPLGGVGATWAVTTATHATTQKYIDEIKVPGQVYLYYVVGVLCVAVLLGWAIVALAPLAPDPVRVTALILVGAFLMVQMPLNWRLAAESAQAFAPNRYLAGAATSGELPEADRCYALNAFLDHPWPDYYRVAITEDAQEDFERVFDEPLCTDPATLARLDALPAG
ncbi:hypothetical protein [Cellulomonas sp. KRMCY2]|uniref:hypothetical protein n=1 Tax=Cellulomonas sp. KRMCY2 TaxID=1304865 RepID=UPI00045E68A8|nr:hypothetical protein [Cellulomonas sp. KRMCY2]